MSTTPTRRLPGPDVVRAIAMLGVVVMNYHGYLIIRGGERTGGWLFDLFDPWEGPLSTRFAATFVLTAGVGVTLLTRSAAIDPQRASEVSWRLVRRGLLLYGGGLVFDFVWAGTILPFYGAMFVLAAVLWRLKPPILIAVGSVAALSAGAIVWWQHEAQLDGHDTSWLSRPGPRSPRGLLLDLFVNGTHPLLPWLAFFCAGIVLGRYLGQPRLLRLAGGAGVAVWVVARLIAAARSGATADLLLSPHPFDRGVVYTLSALASAVAVFVLVNELSNRFADSGAVVALQRAGQLSLTIYLAHALLFNLVVDWLGLIEPGGVVSHLCIALAYWLTATTAAIAYQQRFGRGPAEALYRRLT